MNKKILIVDDDKATIEYLEFLFSNTYGYEVRTAFSGDEALKSIESEIPDLVFLDLMMPKLSGYEVCCKIRANPRTINLPIILYTSTTLGSDEITKGIEIGADEFLIKPFNITELQVKLQRLLARHSEELGYNPLTKLPGNTYIEKELTNRLDREGEFAFCYLDIDNFRVYNNFYGYQKGDEVILFTANTIKIAISEMGNSADFIGHIGGDDFIFITSIDKADRICEYIIDRFDKIILKHYDEVDSGKGFMLARDKDDKLKEYPMMTVSIGILTNTIEEFMQLPIIIEKLTDLKIKARKDPERKKGSYIAKL